MSSSLKTYTQETRWLLDLKLDLKQKLSSMLSFTEQETPKSELSLAEAQQMGHDLSRDFSEIHLLLQVYENALAEQLREAISLDWMDDFLELDQNTRH